MSDMPVESMQGTVLCIEDDETTLALTVALLKAYPGIRVLQAGNGWDGVRLARAEHPEVVLLDMHLPDIGGLQVVRELSDEIWRFKLSVILLTGDTLTMDIVKAMSLGAHDYWIKPIRRDKLEAGLRQSLARPRRSA